MNTLSTNLSLALSALLALGGCCMGGSGGATPAVPADPSALAPATPGGPNPTTIAIGAAPITVNVAAAPRWTLAVAAPSELQIDALGMPADAQLSVLDANGWTVATDSDSGEGYDARLAAFLAPGTYTVRVHEYNHAAASVQVSVTQPAPFTPAAAIAPGAPPATVTTPSADWDRPASAELTITIAAAGRYRIQAAATDSGMCTSRIELIQNAASIDSNSYGGPDSSAQLERDLTPGTYTLRVRDTIYRACTHAVSVTAI